MVPVSAKLEWLNSECSINESEIENEKMKMKKKERSSIMVINLKIILDLRFLSCRDFIFKFSWIFHVFTFSCFRTSFFVTVRIENANIEKNKYHKIIYGH